MLCSLMTKKISEAVTTSFREFYSHLHSEIVQGNCKNSLFYKKLKKNTKTVLESDLNIKTVKISFFTFFGIFIPLIFIFMNFCGTFNTIFSLFFNSRVKSPLDTSYFMVYTTMIGIFIQASVIFFFGMTFSLFFITNILTMSYNLSILKLLTCFLLSILLFNKRYAIPRQYGLVTYVLNHFKKNSKNLIISIAQSYGITLIFGIILPICSWYSLLQYFTLAVIDSVLIFGIIHIKEFIMCLLVYNYSYSYCNEINYGSDIEFDKNNTFKSHFRKFNENYRNYSRQFNTKYSKYPIGNINSAINSNNIEIFLPFSMINLYEKRKTSFLLFDKTRERSIDHVLKLIEDKQSDPCGKSPDLNIVAERLAFLHSTDLFGTEEDFNLFFMIAVELYNLTHLLHSVKRIEKEFLELTTTHTEESITKNGNTPLSLKPESFTRKTVKRCHFVKMWIESHVKMWKVRRIKKEIEETVENLAEISRKLEPSDGVLKQRRNSSFSSFEWGISNDTAALIFLAMEESAFELRKLEVILNIGLYSEELVECIKKLKK